MTPDVTATSYHPPHDFYIPLVKEQRKGVYGMRSIWLALLIVGLAVPSVFAGDKPLKRHAKIYIEEMEGDLDGFIRAEMVKQKVPLDVLLSPDGVDYILTGSLVIQEKRSWHEGWLSAEKDHNVANIMVVDPKEKKMIWASEAGDRSWWWGSLKRGGQRKTAERLVKNIKSAIQ